MRPNRSCVRSGSASQAAIATWTLTWSHIGKVAATTGTSVVSTRRCASNLSRTADRASAYASCVMRSMKSRNVVAKPWRSSLIGPEAYDAPSHAPRGRDALGRALLRLLRVLLAARDERGVDAA